MRKKLLKLIPSFLLGMVFSMGVTNAQSICSATNSYGCSIDWFDAVVIKNSSGQTASFTGLTCANTGATNKLMTNGACLDIMPGEEIEMYISNGCTYGENAGVWIDLNGDLSFSADECISGPSGPLGLIAAYQNKTAKLKIPCGKQTTGTVMMRVRCMYSSFTANQGCGTATNYGNIMDFEVNLLKVPTPSANFAVPKSDNYVKAPIKFQAGGAGTWTYQWKFDKADKVINNSANQGQAAWNNPGTYAVDLKVDYCGIQDSATKTVKIIAPTAAPVADFIADNNDVELGFDVQLFDLSTNGAISWAWEIFSPTGIDDQTETVQNPTFTLSEIGMYKVCLTSANDIGSSQTTCKSKYIECLSTLDNYMGPQKISATKIGRLFDHAGPTGDYANGRKPSIDYFKIFPCGAKEIRVKFKELKLADKGDKLRFYDSEEADPAAEISPADGINGANQSLYDTLELVFKSGAVYITFESDGAGTSRGFIIEWESDLETPTAPKAKWTTPYYNIGNGVEAVFTNATSNTKGLPDYYWSIDGVQEGTGSEFTYKFTDDGTFDICLIASTCTGVDSFCNKITVSTPTQAGYVDFKASNLRPNIGSIVNFTTESDYADIYEWSIFPSTFTYENGTSSKSKNPQISFKSGGAYTFTLSAYNDAGGRSLTEKKVIKNKYVVCVDYCVPITSMTSKDISINTVKVTDKTGRILLNNATGGNVSYTDYTDLRKTNMTFGGQYKVEIERKSSANDINYKVWIDFNIDGDFDDANEEVISIPSSNATSVNGTFTVPSIAQSFEGNTRMRIGASYSNFSNSPCGVNQVGEFEDYLVSLNNDLLPPSITLVGSDTVRVERSTSNCYQEVVSKTYFGFDPTEGDISNKVEITSDLDCQAAGIYNINFQLTDASGNKAPAKNRTVIVVLDRTAPVLTLQGQDTVNVEQCGTFQDPGAVASDNVDGDLSSAIKVSGQVNPSVVGEYPLVYSVSDAQGNLSELTRIVIVKDTKNPGIYKLSNRITDGMSLPVQINTAFVDDIYALDECNGNIFLSRTPGFNGVVNNQVRATYPIVYNAKDPSGNKADEDGFTINWVVDDYVAPSIELNTLDTIYHDVNQPYYSRSVTVGDNYYPAASVSITKTGSIDPYTLGSYFETFTATDPSGNKTIKTRCVKVVDRIAPQLTAPVVSACINTPFWAMSGLIIKDNYYSAADLKDLIKVVSNNVNIFEAGTYSIVYQVTDPSGNSSMAVTREVIVDYAPNCQNTFLGTNEDLKKSIKVFPNPTTEVLNISSVKSVENVRLQLINAIGQTMIDDVKSFNSQEVQSINVRDIPAGIYYLTLTAEADSYTTTVMIK